MKIISLLTIIVLLISTICPADTIRVVTEINMLKEVNGNAGLEVLLKTTIPLQNGIDIKFGVSEGYTAQRSSIMSMNHAGYRLDCGVYWTIGDIMLGYTHSHRSWFDGAAPVDIFEYDSIDVLSLRKEFEL